MSNAKTEQELRLKKLVQEIQQVPLWQVIMGCLSVNGWTAVDIHEMTAELDSITASEAEIKTQLEHDLYHRELVEWEGGDRSKRKYRLTRLGRQVYEILELG